MASKVRTVLIVEDEPLVRMHEADIVESAGFATVLAGDAEEALERLAEGEIHILLTDVALPGRLNGLELAQRVRGTWPAVQIVVASGHVPSNAFADAIFIAKPFTSGQLLAALESVR